MYTYICYIFKIKYIKYLINSIETNYTHSPMIIFIIKSKCYVYTLKINFIIYFDIL
jgi:hypothetical protein